MSRTSCIVRILAVAAMTSCRDQDPAASRPLALTLMPDQAVLLAGDSVRLELYEGARNDEPRSGEADWSSSDTAVVAARPGGWVHARSFGKAAVTARLRSTTVSAAITVDTAISVRIAQRGIVLSPGDSAGMQAELTGASGARFTGQVVQWQSRDTSVARVNGNGRITATKAGMSTVVSRRGALADSVTVQVLAAPLRTQSSCAADTATTHSGTIAGGTWTRAAGPHIVIGTVTTTGALTIEAGSVVCGMPGASLIALGSGSLITGIGTPQNPIRFTAADSAQRWRGVRTVGGGAALTHVLFEYGDVYGSNIQVDSSRFRQGSVGLFGNLAGSWLRRSTVDSGDVSIARSVFEDNVIRHGRLVLEFSNGGYSIVNGGRIEDSPGVGVEAVHSLGRVPSVTSTRPPRIVRSRSYPVRVTHEIFSALWPTRAAHDSLRGNFNDTLAVWAYYSIAAPNRTPVLDISRGFVWVIDCLTLAEGPCVFTVSGLNVEPGSSMVLKYTPLIVTGPARVAGTATDRIRIAGTDFGLTGNCGVTLSGTAESFFSDVDLVGGCLFARDEHRVRLERVRATGDVHLAAPGSRIVDSEITNVRVGGAFSLTRAALRITARDVSAQRVTVRNASGSASDGQQRIPAIEIEASDVVLQDCDITDNENDGVLVRSGANVRITDCNIERNGGTGVVNLGTSVVDARANWWGDPAGPLGPAGNGVRGPVHFNPHRPVRR